MNIFVGNLNPETAAEGLKKLFSEFGEITTSKVIMDNATGMSRGFGFVEMVDHTAAQDAIDNLDFSYFEGNIISVKEAKQNTTRPGQGSYGNSSSSGPRPFRPRTTSPRPGGYNSNSGGGSYNRDNNSGGGNYNRDNTSGGGSYNRDNNSGGGSYNRDNNSGGSGSYNKDNNSGSYNSNFNKN